MKYNNNKNRTSNSFKATILSSPIRKTSFFLLYAVIMIASSKVNTVLNRSHSTFFSSATAFVVPYRTRCSSSSRTAAIAVDAFWKSTKPLPQLATALDTTTTTRLYHSSPLRNRDDDNEKTGGILTKVKNVAKKILPKKWFQSEQERQIEEQRQQITKSMKNDIKQIFQDAPLPIRMFGSVITPLLTNLISNIAETAASQKEIVNDIYEQASICVQTDDNVNKILGTPIQIGTIFSQSSSSSTINGISSIRVQLAFQVAGSKQQGTVRVISSSDNNKPSKIQRLELQCNNGNVISVRTTPGSTTTSSSRWSNNNYNNKNEDDNIIEAEIIEKKTKK